MSTIEYQGSQTRTAFNDPESIGKETQLGYSIRTVSGTVSGQDALKFNPALKSSLKHKFSRRNSEIIKRRLRGFLVELPNATQGQEARVAFVENGETILYDLPADPMRKAGITLPNQPFEMDEIEIKGEDGSFTISYRYKALAKPTDAYIDEKLNLDDERKRKRALILKAFAQNQD